MIRLTHTIAIGAGLVLLGGCSWLPGSGAKHAGGQYAAQHGAQYGGHYGSQHGGQYGQQAPGFGNCQVPHAQAPVPQGCDPAMVTVGLPGHGGAFPQAPQFGAGYGSASYATGGYGSATGAQAVRYEERVKTGELRKPRWRGQLGLGIEKSISGNLLNYDLAGDINPEAFYDPTEFFEGSTTGSPADGSVRTTQYTSVTEEIFKPTISQDDVYSTPLSLTAGLEYIVAPRTTLFANAGYTTSEGNSGNAVQVNSELRRTVSGTDFFEETTVDADGNATTTVTSVDITPQTTFIPNVENVAAFAYDFTDLRRIDLEAGARHYFNPLSGSGLNKVSPFVGASAGASHFNGAAFTTTQTQAFLRRSFDDGGNTAGNLYEVVPSQAPSERTEIYDDQWVPRGALNAGLEWQATPRTALAFETGIQIEGGRKYSNGNREDENISIPLKIRGSYNF